MLRRLLKAIFGAHKGGRLSESSIESAVDVVEKNGMKAHAYFAGIGSREDNELSYALDTLEAAGFIITNTNGTLVGKVATRCRNSDEITQQRRAKNTLIKAAAN